MGHTNRFLFYTRKLHALAYYNTYLFYNKAFPFRTKRQENAHFILAVHFVKHANGYLKFRKQGPALGLGYSEYRYIKL